MRDDLRNLEDVIDGAPDECPSHDWQRTPSIERANQGAHVFRCTWCRRFGWRKRFRKNTSAPPDPIRVYGGKRQVIMLERENAPLKESKISVKPMSARRARNGGFVPGGSNGGR